MLYTVQMLSRPPLATRFPEGEKETLITQADFSGTATNWEIENFCYNLHGLSETSVSIINIFKFELFAAKI